MIVALLILIVLILLFGAAAVKGWIGAILVTLVAGVILIATLTLASAEFGKDSVYVVLFGGGILLLVGSMWARGNFDRPDIEKPSETVAESIEEKRRARVLEEQAAMFRSPTILSKDEKRRRKSEYKQRQ